MLRQNVLFTAALLAALSATAPGCASYHQEEAVLQQRAADDLRRGGATDAGRAAQERADAHQRAGSCSFFECVIEGLFSVAVNMVFPDKSQK